MTIETEWLNWDCSLKDCEFESCLEGDEYRLIDYSRQEEDVIKKNERNRSNQVKHKGRQIKPGEDQEDVKPQHLSPFKLYIEMNAGKQIFSREGQREG